VRTDGVKVASTFLSWFGWTITRCFKASRMTFNCNQYSTFLQLNFRGKTKHRLTALEDENLVSCQSTNERDKSGHEDVLHTCQPLMYRSISSSCTMPTVPNCRRSSKSFKICRGLPKPRASSSRRSRLLLSSFGPVSAACTFRHAEPN